MALIDRMLGKSFETVRNLIDRVEKGQSDDAPIELPGTFKHRDTHGKEHLPDWELERARLGETEPDALAEQRV